MSEKKLRKRVEDTELKDYGLRETALEEQAPEESAAEDFVQEVLQIRLPGRTLDAVSYTHLTLPTICSV